MSTQYCMRCSQSKFKTIVDMADDGCPGYKPIKPSPPPTKKSSYEDYMKNDPNALELI